jgi:hypothetical protein
MVTSGEVAVGVFDNDQPPLADLDRADGAFVYQLVNRGSADAISLASRGDTDRNGSVHVCAFRACPARSLGQPYTRVVAKDRNIEIIPSRHGKRLRRSRRLTPDEPKEHILGIGKSQQYS